MLKIFYVLILLYLLFYRPAVSSLFSPAIKPFKNQIYEDLKRHAQESQTLFEDPEFPANDSSLFYKGNVGQLPGDVVWKRPKVCVLFFVVHLFFLSSLA